MLRKILILVFLLGSISFLSQAQSIEESQIDSLKSQEEYWYADKELPELEVKNVSKSYKFPPWLSTLIQFLFWGGIVAALLYALYYLSQNIDFGSRDPKLAIDYITEVESEEQLNAIPYDQLISEAKLKKNYNLAIRWYFLRLIYELNKKEKITFSKYKTNQDYKNQLLKSMGDDFMLFFKLCLRSYEYAWFGKFPIGEALFLNIENEFKEASSRV